jgi:UDP-2-acetamido-3-amino-2,3-dideoxy-glucuronate N-acetyltransferase
LENRASLFRAARLGSAVFVGPHSALLNDKYPRAQTVSGKLQTEADWEVNGVIVGDGASTGGGCTVVPGVRIGVHAMIGAGSVVTGDVPLWAFVGSPARLVARACECEHPSQR